MNVEQKVQKVNKLREKRTGTAFVRTYVPWHATKKNREYQIHFLPFLFSNSKQFFSGGRTFHRPEQSWPNVRTATHFLRHSTATLVKETVKPIHFKGKILNVGILYI